MTPEQALGNFEYLINLGVQKGIFPDANLVLAMTEAHNVLHEVMTQKMQVVIEGDIHSGGNRINGSVSLKEKIGLLGYVSSNTGIPIIGSTSNSCGEFAGSTTTTTGTMPKGTVTNTTENHVKS